ncbi:MAG: Fur family transcriptional regulator [bacterium]|nr:Fur family transcriptional regulator [bacterium]
MVHAPEIIENLKRRGFRETPVRFRLLELLSNSSTPLSVPEIIGKLSQQNLKPNKTTLYREIDFLMNQDILVEVRLHDRKKRYEITQQHHHHLVCLKCDSITDIKLKQDLGREETRLAKRFNFAIERHALEFFGYCNNCQ